MRIGNNTLNDVIGLATVGSVLCLVPPALAMTVVSIAREAVLAVAQEEAQGDPTPESNRFPPDNVKRALARGILCTDKAFWAGFRRFDEALVRRLTPQTTPVE